MIDKKGKPDKIDLYNLLYPTNAITKKDCEIDRQAVTDKTRNIDNWLKGKNYPKRISDVLELCNALSCDLDYFFTKMSAPTHDVEFISKETGLSTDAIETLKSLKIAYRFDEDMKIFNYIMSNRRLFSIFLSNLSDYIQPEYDVPIHPEQDEKTKNIKYVESVDAESNSISVNKERCVYVGKENGEFNGKPLYDIKSIPVSQLSTLNLLQIQEILQKWKDNYKKEMIDEII